MIIAQITGGLGNQMFQYAPAMALSLQKDVPLKLDLQSFKREILPELEVPRSFALTAFKNFNYDEASPEEIEQYTSQSFFKKKTQKLLPAHKRKIYNERDYTFDGNFFKANSSIYLKGHRQSEKYFKPFEKEIRNIYQLREDLISDVKFFGEKLTSLESLSVHIRRGDYLRLPIILDWHGVLDKSYYSSAIETVLSQYPSTQIFYFSDDVEWVDKELVGEYPGTIVSGNISNTAYQDFYLMQSCKHQIVANSSFSWWAAWLNSNPHKKVIAPLKWFNNAPYNTRDLIPDNWLRL